MTFVKLGEGSLGECSLREGSLGKDPWGGVAGGGIPGECSAELRLLRLCWVFFFWSVCLNIGSLPPPPPLRVRVCPGEVAPGYTPPPVYLFPHVLPQRDGSLPQRDGSLPQRDGSLPQRDGSLPQRDGILPQRDGILPQNG